MDTSPIPPPKVVFHLYKGGPNIFYLKPVFLILKAESHLTYLLTGSPEIHVLWHHKGCCLKRQRNGKPSSTPSRVGKKVNKV